jgi:hypothetical protein
VVEKVKMATAHMLFLQEGVVGEHQKAFPSTLLQKISA